MIPPLAGGYPGGAGKARLVAVLGADACDAEQNQSLAGLLTDIDDARVMSRSRRGLAAYLRVWVLDYVQTTQGVMSP